MFVVGMSQSVPTLVRQHRQPGIFVQRQEGRVAQRPKYYDISKLQIGLFTVS